MQRLLITTLGLASLLTLAPLSSSILPLQTQPAFAAEGDFVRADKNTEGSFKIVEEEGTRYLELSEDFRTSRGPDLFVLLHRQSTPESYAEEDYINLGMMDRFSGSQRFEIPEDVDVEDFQSAVIWCRQFNVTFGYAELSE